MHKGYWPSPRFPGKCSLVPALLVVAVIIRIRNAGPTNERRLNTLAGPRGKIEQPNTLRRQQPLMTSAGRDIYQFLFHIDGNHSQRLNHVHDQQRVASTSDAPETFEVSAKT